MFLRTAREEPILSVPSVHGGEDVSNSMRFLVLMSRGVYNAYEQATGVSKEEVGFQYTFNRSLSLSHSCSYSPFLFLISLNLHNLFLQTSKILDHNVKTLKSGGGVQLAFKIQCHTVNNTLLHPAFSAN